MTKIKTKEIQTKETKQTKAKKVVVRKTFKILTVVGARPQFIKSAMFSQALDKYNKRHVEDNTILFEEILVHTGQHYDVNMSDVFFKELGMKKEKYNLGINGGSHANQTGRMMIELENVLFEEKPDLIVIFGDTNSTVVGAIVGSKLNIPIAHVESGFRSFDKTMPEEINRIIADHVSTYLFCFTTSSMRLLENEGIKNNVHYVGDITYDAVLKYSEHKSKLYNELKKELKLNTPEGDRTKQYIYCTIHRPSNTDSIDNLKSIFNALLESGKTIILPLHPRTRHMLEEYKLYNRYSSSKNKKSKIHFVEPVGYFDSLNLIKNAAKVITDSGGILKEAYFLKKPCIILRDNVELVEAVKHREAILVGSNHNKLLDAIKNFRGKGKFPSFSGDGTCADKIVNIIKLNTLLGAKNGKN